MENIDWQEEIHKTCIEQETFLIGKNKSYGNSVFDPIHKFSLISALEQINVRIDDKLSRIFRGEEYPGEDTLQDLSGYYVIRKTLMRVLGLEAKE